MTAETESTLPCWAHHKRWHKLSLLNGCAGCEIERLEKELTAALEREGHLRTACSELSAARPAGDVSPPQETK